MQKLGSEDWNILIESDEEYFRRGHFDRIFPTKKNIDIYSKFFEYNRWNNIILWKLIKSPVNFIEKIVKKIYNTPV